MGTSFILRASLLLLTPFLLVAPSVPLTPFLQLAPMLQPLERCRFVPKAAHIQFSLLRDQLDVLVRHAQIPGIAYQGDAV